MITAKQFRDKQLGLSIDVDGAAGVQCVDLFKQACYLAGKSAFALGGSGYADEIVHRFDSLGLGSYFDLVSLANAQYGDWIVWDKGSLEAPDSHVAMFVGWQGNSRVIVLGQNQFNQKAANEGAISTNGIIGVLRLKEWVIADEPTQPSPSLKYGVGTHVCVQQLSRSADGTAGVVPSHYTGMITEIHEGQPYPYLLDTNAGFVNDSMIDADQHIPEVDEAPSVSQPTVINEGDLVGVKEGVKDYNGSDAGGVIRGKVCYTLDELIGDRAVLDITGICTPFNVNDLFK